MGNTSSAIWCFCGRLGPQVEDAIGPIKSFAFYLQAGLIANFAQIAIAPGSIVSSLGASGAIAAVLGAFVLAYPRDRIKTVLLIGIFVEITLIPAVLLIGFWFLLQIVSQFGAIAEAQNGGVAYMAHIGGFIYGAIAGRWSKSPAAGVTSKLWNKDRDHLAIKVSRWPDKCQVSPAASIRSFVGVWLLECPQREERLLLRLG